MKEKALFVNEFWLKALAVLFMTLDHIGLFLMAYNVDATSTAYLVGLAFRAAGRLAFPLFAFMLAEGMRHTHNKLAYVVRIGILYISVLAVEILLTYAFNFDLGPSPIADLFFGALTLFCLSLPRFKKFFAILPIGVILLSFGVQLYNSLSAVLTVVWFPSYLQAGYNLLGLLILLGFYYARPLASYFTKKSLHDLPPEEYQSFAAGPSFQRLVNLIGISFFALITVIFWGLKYTYVLSDGTYPLDIYNISFQTYSLIAALLLYCYNGQRGYDGKAFRIATYSYFPLHIIIIFAIFRLIFGY